MNQLLAVLPLILCAGFSSVFAQHHAAPDAMSMGIWNPTQKGECSKAIHDSYSAVNPFDGKRYPIWHPPVHPGSPAVPATATSPAIAAVPPCPFGHEHGMDPGESLLGSNIIYFGYVNEQMMLSNPNAAHHRHEDHVGHKIYYANDFLFRARKKHTLPETIRCNFIGKLHQGTHSRDAFTNNLHEQYFKMVCDNGGVVDVQLMSAIGPAGFVTRDCKNPGKLYAGVATPANSPTKPSPTNSNRSIGDRIIPTEDCLVGVAKVLASKIREMWRSPNSIQAIGGGRAFNFSFYHSVSNPSRFYDSTTQSLLRTIDTCWQPLAPGVYLVTSAYCVQLRAKEAALDQTINWDSIHSPFKGDVRSVRMTGWEFFPRPATHPTVWFTDVMGQHAQASYSSATPLRQVVSAVDQSYEYLGGSGKSGTEVVKSTATDPSVHAPN